MKNCSSGQYFCHDRGKCMPIPKGHKVRKDGELVKEVAPHHTFLHRALPEIKKYADTSNLTCLFEETQQPLFCKSKVLNDLIVAADTKFVANYDADCILPLSSYHEASSLCRLSD